MFRMALWSLAVFRAIFGVGILKVALVKDVALTGIADFLRKEYRIPDNKAILAYSSVPTRSSEPGGYDISWSITDDDRTQKLLERAEARKRRLGIVRSERAKKRAKQERERRAKTTVSDPPKRAF
jgi:hypothetical protein